MKLLEGIDLLKDGVWTQANPTIEEFIPGGTLKDVKGEVIELSAVRYKNSDKIHILNKTNFTFMRLLFGTEKTEKWIGQKVTLYAAAGDWFGEKNQCALRVRLPSDRPIPKRYRAQLGRDLTGTEISKP